MTILDVERDPKIYSIRLRNTKAERQSLLRTNLVL